MSAVLCFSSEQQLAVTMSQQVHFTLDSLLRAAHLQMLQVSIDNLLRVAGARYCKCFFHASAAHSAIRTSVGYKNS